MLHSKHLMRNAGAASCHQIVICHKLQAAAAPALRNVFHSVVRKGVNRINLLTVMPHAAFLANPTDKQLRNTVAADVLQRVAKLLQGRLPLDEIPHLADACFPLLRQVITRTVSDKFINAVYNLCIFLLIGRRYFSSGLSLRQIHLR